MGRNKVIIKIYKSKSGFTLVELIITVAIAAIIGGIVFAFFNPLSQLARGRNNQRTTHINIIASAAKERLIEYRGAFGTNCSSGPLPATTTQIGTGAGNYNLSACLIPNYLTVMPQDPITGTATSTGYTILYTSSTMQITISAPAAELGEVISVIR